MDGPGHYREAERLLGEARISTEHFYGEQEAVPTLLAARVQATPRQRRGDSNRLKRRMDEGSGHLAFTQHLAPSALRLRR